MSWYSPDKMEWKVPWGCRRGRGNSLSQNSDGKARANASPGYLEPFEARERLAWDAQYLMDGIGDMLTCWQPNRMRMPVKDILAEAHRTSTMVPLMSSTHISTMHNGTTGSNTMGVLYRLMRRTMIGAFKFCDWKLFALKTWHDSRIFPIKLLCKLYRVPSLIVGHLSLSLSLI